MSLTPEQIVDYPDTWQPSKKEVTIPAQNLKPEQATQDWRKQSRVAYKRRVWK